MPDGPNSTHWEISPRLTKSPAARPWPPPPSSSSSFALLPCSRRRGFVPCRRRCDSLPPGPQLVLFWPPPFMGLADLLLHRFLFKGWAVLRAVDLGRFSSAANGGGGFRGDSQGMECGFGRNDSRLGSNTSSAYLAANDKLS
ncbi:hypothetical protein EJB05_08734 [Eragrostis curvula]|uniref:Uncharacterized protein n=1 Tax=Eragrostis curvula TaxID=38414 RepID=A0A5J9W352_9POAL|nr:hypothetical protein EJB05_08734 [Eragrostis curvula]